MSLEPRIELEVWDGPLGRRERLPEATPTALREALLRLDGHRVDGLWIEHEGVGVLGIGGGPARFVVVSIPADGPSAHVVVGDEDGSTVNLQVGGQMGNYPTAMVLSASRVFPIAEQFLLAGTFEPALRWVLD